MSKLANSIYLDHGMRNALGNGFVKSIALNMNNSLKVSKALDSTARQLWLIWLPRIYYVPVN